MIIYVTGASGSGKTTLLNHIPIKGFDLDDIYENNWTKHRKIETVQKGVKKDIDKLISLHEDILFVGLQGREYLTFTPDIVYVLVREDYEQYYRDKLVRDLNLLCKYKDEFTAVLKKKPIAEFREHFWSNDIVNMKSLDEFKQYVQKINKSIQADFPKSNLLTGKEIIRAIKSLHH